MDPLQCWLKPRLSCPSPPIRVAFSKSGEAFSGRGNYLRASLVEHYVTGDKFRRPMMTKTSTQNFHDASNDNQKKVDRDYHHHPANDNPSADLVRVYLNGIGKTALLSAEDEVELAQAIEIGLYAEYKLNTAEKLTRAEKRDMKILVKEGKKARSHLLEANLRLVVS